jgi:hypothetical protein
MTEILGPKSPRTRWAALGVVGAVVFASEPARARDDGEALFSQALMLIAEGRCDRALPLLLRVQSIEHGIGTQYNIAFCQEREGRLGSAYRNYEEVVKLARASGKRAREESARARLEELRARVPAFIVRTQEPDALVKMDGTVVERDAWAFIPVDPGEHRIDVTAATKVSWSATFAAPPPGTRQEIVVPPLAVLERSTVRTIIEQRGDARRKVGWVVGAIGAAALGTAIVTGVMVLDAKSTARDHCAIDLPNGEKRCVDNEGIDAVERGRTLVPVNYVAWAIAGVGLAAGAYFLLTSSSKRPAATLSLSSRGVRVVF